MPPLSFPFHSTTAPTAPILSFSFNHRPYCRYPFLFTQIPPLSFLFHSTTAPILSFSFNYRPYPFLFIQLPPLSFPIYKRLFMQQMKSPSTPLKRSGRDSAASSNSRAPGSNGSGGRTPIISKTGTLVASPAGLGGRSDTAMLASDFPTFEELLLALATKIFNPGARLLTLSTGWRATFTPAPLPSFKSCFAFVALWPIYCLLEHRTAERMGPIIDVQLLLQLFGFCCMYMFASVAWLCLVTSDGLIMYICVMFASVAWLCLVTSNRLVMYICVLYVYLLHAYV